MSTTIIFKKKNKDKGRVSFCHLVQNRKSGMGAQFKNAYSAPSLPLKVINVLKREKAY